MIFCMDVKWEVFILFDDMINVLLDNVFFVLIFYSLLLVNFKESFYVGSG